MAGANTATDVVIYHNPRCSKSRQALAIIREAGIEPTIVEYLKTPPERETLRDLAQAIGVPVSGLLRTKEAAYAEAGLGRPGIGDEEILDAIAAHPILLERPIVVTPLGTRLCRPPERVHEVLPS